MDFVCVGKLFLIDVAMSDWMTMNFVAGSGHLAAFEMINDEAKLLTPGTFVVYYNFCLLRKSNFFAVFMDFRM